MIVPWLVIVTCMLVFDLLVFYSLVLRCFTWSHLGLLTCRVLIITAVNSFVFNLIVFCFRSLQASLLVDPLFTDLVLTQIIICLLIFLPMFLILLLAVLLLLSEFLKQLPCYLSTYCSHPLVNLLLISYCLITQSSLSYFGNQYSVLWYCSVLRIFLFFFLASRTK